MTFKVKWLLSYCGGNRGSGSVSVSSCHTLIEKALMAPFYLALCTQPFRIQPHLLSWSYLPSLLWSLCVPYCSVFSHASGPLLKPLPSSWDILLPFSSISSVNSLIWFKTSPGITSSYKLTLALCLALQICKCSSIDGHPHLTIGFLAIRAVYFLHETSTGIVLNKC